MVFSCISSMGNSASSERVAGIVQQFDDLKDDRTGLLTRTKFHESLSAVETRGYRRLRETPLADMLFDCSASSSEGLNRNEFLFLVTAVFSENRQERIDITFKALASKTPNTPHLVAIKDVVTLVENCWRLAGQILIDRRHLKKRTVGGEDVSKLILTFVENTLPAIAEEARSELQACCAKVTGSLTRDQFTAWLSRDRTVRLCIDSESVEVPTSFAHLEKTAEYPKLAIK